MKSSKELTDGFVDTKLLSGVAFTNFRYGLHSLDIIKKVLFEKKKKEKKNIFCVGGKILS